MTIRNVRFASVPLLCFVAFLAHAEGGCPPGMYPIGGQGVRGVSQFRARRQGE